MGLRDLYFVVLSALAALLVWLWVVEPRVRANEVTRARLKAVADETRVITEDALLAGARARALKEGDPFFVTAALRWYWELQGRPWREAAEEGDHAGHSESRGS